MSNVSSKNTEPDTLWEEVREIEEERNSLLVERKKTLKRIDCLEDCREIMWEKIEEMYEERKRMSDKIEKLEEERDMLSCEAKAVGKNIDRFLDELFAYKGECRRLTTVVDKQKKHIEELEASQ